MILKSKYADLLLTLLSREKASVHLTNICRFTFDSFIQGEGVSAYDQYVKVSNLTLLSREKGSDTWLKFVLHFKKCLNFFQNSFDSYDDASSDTSRTVSIQVSSWTWTWNVDTSQRKHPRSKSGKDFKTIDSTLCTLPIQLTKNTNEVFV